MIGFVAVISGGWSAEFGVVVAILLADSGGLCTIGFVAVISGGWNSGLGFVVAILLADSGGLGSIGFVALITRFAAELGDLAREPVLSAVTTAFDGPQDGEGGVVLLIGVNGDLVTVEGVLAGPAPADLRAGIGDTVDEFQLGGVGGTVGVEESLEIFGGSGGEGKAAGGESVGGGVAGGAGFARSGFGAAGASAVAAGSFDLRWSGVAWHGRVL